ncbi:hypothetical protein ABT010_27205 [Streptomyces sp. NPDC002668]
MCALHRLRLLTVEAESGTTPKLKVSALAGSGRRVDRFEVGRGQRNGR